MKELTKESGYELGRFERALSRLPRASVWTVSRTTYETVRTRGFGGEVSVALFDSWVAAGFVTDAPPKDPDSVILGQGNARLARVTPRGRAALAVWMLRYPDEVAFLAV